MATVETLELKIVDSSIKTANGLNKLAATLQRLKNITTGNLGLNKVSNQMEKLNKALSGINEEYVQRLERVARALKTISNNGKLKLPTYNQLKRATEPKKSKEMDAPQAPTGVNAFLTSLRSFLGISNATKGSIRGIANEAKRAGDSMKNASKRTYGFIDSAKFLLKYQLIFTIFSTLANALKEGIGNLYNWSKAMGGSFARSLDTAKSKVTLLKNSVATALAPALTALIPVFNAVANAIVFCLNAIAQLISALRGLGTWTKATESVGDYTEAVKGAGAAQKGLLASFDELNIIASKAGGGGGGMADAWEGAFEEKELSPFFKWIKDNLTTVKVLAGAIGGAILAWRFTSGFVDGLGGIGNNFKTIAAVALIVGGAIGEIISVSEALTKGNTWQTFAGQLGSTAAMALGLFIAFGKLGGGIGLVIGGVGMFITSLKEWIETGEASNEVLATMSTSAVLFGAGLSLLTGNWLPLIIGGIGAGLVWIIGKWDDIKAVVKKAWDNVSAWWTENITTPLKTAWKDGMNWMVTRWSGIGSIISGAWENVKGWLSDKKSDFTTAWNGAMEYLTGAWDNVKGAASGAWDKVKGWFSDKKSDAETAWSGTKDYLVGIWDSVKASIDGAWESLKSWMDENVLSPVKSALDSVKTWITDNIITPINSVLAPIINLINTIIDWVSKKDTKVIEIKTTKNLPLLHGVTPSGHSYTETYNRPNSHGAGMVGMEMIDFKQYSSGGFPTEGQLFMAREAGPELVGTIGGRSAVANNDQIVAGVANGVAAGQAEQNALLRKQNELLTQILRKEFSAKVVPSAGLGRVNAQSNAMYSRVAGVNT